MSFTVRCGQNERLGSLVVRMIVSARLWSECPCRDQYNDFAPGKSLQ